MRVRKNRSVLGALVRVRDILDTGTRVTYRAIGLLAKGDDEWRTGPGMPPTSIP